MIAAVLALLGTASGCGATNTRQEHQTGTATTAKSVDSRTVVVTIGDSIMKGTGLTPPEAWPALLAQSNHWQLTNLGCNSAGFHAIGNLDDCNSDFEGLVATAAALHPSIVIISGSSNDLGQENKTLSADTIAALKALRAALPTAKIVGLSPVWNDTPVPAQLTQIDRQVRQAVLAVRGQYLEIAQPLAGRPELLQEDEVHPTAAGQHALATAIAKAFRSAHL